MEDTERRYGFHTEVATGADVARHIASPLYHAAAYETRSGHLHRSNTHWAWPVPPKAWAWCCTKARPWSVCCTVPGPC